jgi:UDP-N-acetylglucosamine:LPS N-acetylglucosamine transferase
MSSERSGRPRVLIAMIEAGGGHRAPALALEAALQSRHPGRFDVDVLDIMRHVGDVELDRRHKESWKWMLAHPRITFALQSAADHLVPVSWTQAVQGRMLAGFRRHLSAFVTEQGYDLIVGVHFMPLQAAAMAKRRGELAATVIGLDTDPFDGHALWAVRDVDEMIVASGEARALLSAKGVPTERIRIFGYPLSLAFVDAEADPQAARRRLGLEPGRLTVLHTPGGEGIAANVERSAAAVLEADLDLQYVVIAGRNEVLQRRLQALGEAHLARGGCTLLRAEGFTSAMPDWIAASDLVLAKAGAASTFEALALGRPVFHTSYVAPNEKRNLDFCRRHGIGGFVPRPRDVVELLAPLCRDPEPLHRWQERVRALGFKPGTPAIADHLAKLLEAP